MLSELIDFLGSLHPLIVHLPIGIVLLTIAIDVFMRNKNNSVHRIITLGWFFSFFSGLLAALFGWFLGDNGYYFESQLGVHRWSGVAFVSLCFLIWLLKFLNFRFSKSSTRFVNLTAIVLLTITGHFGGEMTHGQNYLVENLPFVKKKISTTSIEKDRRSEVDSLFVYEDLLQPVFEQKCMACHNSKNTYGGLNMSDFKSLVKGGNSGAGIQKGNPYESLIYKRVSFPHDHPKFMPPAGVPMSYDQIATLEWWIDNGAKKQLPVSLARKDPKIQRLMEVQYGLDLREKSFLETLKLDPPSKTSLKALEEDKFMWRFLNPEESFLDITYTRNTIEKNDLISLQQVKNNITWLNLSNTNLKDNDLGYLAELPHLTRLKIQKNPRITDNGIKAIKGLENLSQLNLYGTGVTDAAFESFSMMKGLKKLFLWNTRVTPTGIEKFKAMHPKVEVVAGLR